MNLERPELTHAFREFAAGGHGVLIGAPGVGKTYLLKAMVRELQAAPDSGCLFLPVDRMPFESDADLRAELEVTGDIVSFFEQSDAAAPRVPHRRCSRRRPRRPATRVCPRPCAAGARATV